MDYGNATSKVLSPETLPKGEEKRKTKTRSTRYTTSTIGVGRRIGTRNRYFCILVPLGSFASCYVVALYTLASRESRVKYGTEREER